MVQQINTEYSNLSWRQLLQKISDLALLQNDFKFSDEAIGNQYLGKPPASIDDILKTEDRLGIRLPEDYKEFLLTSNGFKCTSSIGVELFPVEELNFFVNTDRDQVEVWADTMEDNDPIFSAKLRSSIIIGGYYGGEQQLLLIPQTNGQWECWYFASWATGQTVYTNFRSYMEHEIGLLKRLLDESYLR